MIRFAQPIHIQLDSSFYGLDKKTRSSASWERGENAIAYARREEHQNYLDNLHTVVVGKY